jgi:hypothetical protein
MAPFRGQWSHRRIDRCLRLLEGQIKKKFMFGALNLLHYEGKSRQSTAGHRAGLSMILNSSVNLWSFSISTLWTRWDLLMKETRNYKSRDTGLLIFRTA